MKEYNHRKQFLLMFAVTTFCVAALSSAPSCAGEDTGATAQPVPPAVAQAAAPERGGKLTPLQLLQAAHTFFAQKDYDSARRYYLQALPAFPKNFDVLRNLAFCYFSMGRAGYAQAARYYSQAYEINPNSQDVADKLATCYLALKRPAEAAAVLGKVAELPDAPPEAWKKAADAYAEAGNAAQAEAAYGVYLERRPGDLAARAQLGILYGQRKNYAQAMEQFRLVLSSNPNYSPALIGMGRILSWQGQYEESLAQYERVLRLNPSNGEALAGKAFALLWMGRPEQAAPLFSQLHKRYPQDAEVARGLEAAQAATEQTTLAQARRSGNASRIEALYRQRLEKNPRDLEALKALVALTSDPKRCAESIGFARRVLEMTPDDFATELTLARSLSLCQQYAEAIARYQRYLEARPKSEDALFELAQTLFRARRIPEATQAFRNLLELNPHNQDASLGLAQCLGSSGNYSEALVRYDEALKSSPSNYDALQGKAYVLYWTEQFAQARAIFENLRATRPSDPQNTEALENIARAEEAARWAELRPLPGAPPKDFLVFYQKRLASYPDDVSAMKGLAYAQAQLNNLPAALEGYERILDKNPDDLDAQKELARLFGQDGQYDKSIRLYQTVVKNHPDDSSSLDNLARVNLWAGRPAQALPIYKRLLAKDPSNTGYQMQVARLELQLKDYPAAREVLASVLSSEPENREARLALAQLDLRQGRHEDSLKNFDRMLKQNPNDPDALLGKAQVSYLQGNMLQAQTAASAAAGQRPQSFDAVFLLANIEHARGHRRQTKELLNRADQISPGNPEVTAMKSRLREEAAVTIHTSASYGREIGPASEFTSLANIVGTGQNEDIRLETYGTTIGFSLLPRVDSYLSFTSLPTQSPTPSIRGAVAPSSFVFRNAWHVSKFLTLRGGAGLARFGPSEVQLSPFSDEFLTTIGNNFGPNPLSGLGVAPQRVTTFAFSAIGTAGATISLSKKFSIDLDWTRSPAVYLPTPFAMKNRLTETRFTGGVNFFPTPRTELHFEFFYTRLYTGLQVTSVSAPNGAFFAFLPASAPCQNPIPIEIVPPDPLKPVSHECLGATVAQSQTIKRDWGHGGSITFNRIIVHREHFSLDGGYHGIAYGYAGQRVDVRPRVFLGFFNPVFYQNHMLAGRIYGKLFGPVSYDLSGGIGLQRTTSGDSEAMLEDVRKIILPDGTNVTLKQLGFVESVLVGPLKRSGTVTPAFSFKVSPHLTIGIAYTHYNSAQVLGPLRGNVVRLTTDWKFF